MSSSGPDKRDPKMHIKMPGYVPLMSHMLERPNLTRNKGDQGHRVRTLEERIKHVTEAFGKKHNKPLTNEDGK